MRSSAVALHPRSFSNDVMLGGLLWGAWATAEGLPESLSAFLYGVIHQQL